MVAGSPTSVAPGGSVDLSLVFAPEGEGLRAGELTIVSNGTGSPHVVALAGVGVEPTDHERIVDLERRVDAAGIQR